MASKRMFKLSVVSSDAFTAMTLSAQALYFHLNLRADDDGFIDSPLRIMREIGANQGDMEQLLKKRYLIYYESGVIVVKHWRLHNTLRKDRYKPTLYQEEFAQLEEKESGVYTEVGHRNLTEIDNGNQNGNQPQRNLSLRHRPCDALVEGRQSRAKNPAGRAQVQPAGRQHQVSICRALAD